MICGVWVSKISLRNIGRGYIANVTDRYKGLEGGSNFRQKQRYVTFE